MKLRFPFNMASMLLANVGVIVFKLHNLTTFHVFTALFFGIVFLLMYLQHGERLLEKKKLSLRRVRKRLFTRRANILSVAVIWFYVTYSIVAKDVYFSVDRVLATNIMSASYLGVALMSSFYRNCMHDSLQEKIAVAYVILLCFPMNLLQHTNEVLVGLRLFVFFLVFNLELYVGRMLRYRTTFKQLVLCSYFSLIANIWYLVGAIPIVLTHFLEMKHKQMNFNKRVIKKAQTREEEKLGYVSSSSSSSSSTYTNISFDTEVNEADEMRTAESNGELYASSSSPFIIYT